MRSGSGLEFIARTVALITALFSLCASAALAQAPPGIFVDIDSTNTTAVGGTPSPWHTDSTTTDNLWRRRAGYGATAFATTAADREVFEKDAGGVGDAAPLVTTVTGLIPGQTYGIYVVFISVTTESWQVNAGLNLASLETFTRTSPSGRVIDAGPCNDISPFNRNQYLGFIGNAMASAAGTLELYADDGEGTSTSTRTWLEGFLISDPYDPQAMPEGAVEIAPDGAWTWFNDERSIFHQGSLFCGYVKADGQYGITRRDLATGINYHTIISTSASRQRDDHNNPSITVLPDGKLMALYSKHLGGSQFYQRTSLVPLPSSLSDWGPEIVRATPANNTYCNTYRLTGENNAIYNFHRCINFNPTLTISTDNGATWGTSRQMVAVGSNNVRPYPRYVSNGIDRIDLIYTDGHPRDVNNSVYHMYYRGGAFHRTNGEAIATLDELPLDHQGGERGPVIYQYSDAAWGIGQGPDDWIPTGRGWTWDVAYGADDAPVAAFQVQVGTDSTWSTSRIYYYYARWTGTTWQKRFIAQGGRGLYGAESDYGGGMCLDPNDPRVVYISTNAAAPFNLSDVNNVPLRWNNRYEIYRGFTSDGGLTFTWTPVTENSAADNLRPIVPLNHPNPRDLIWFNGTYTTYTTYSTRVLGLFGGLSAKPMGSTEIRLSWSSVDGATGYNVKRAVTSGGPYTTIGTNVTATSYIDSGLSAGTYYYVISPLTAQVEGAHSNEASATAGLVRDFFTELFNGTDKLNDTAYSTYTFIPADNDNGYVVTRAAGNSFPSDTTSGSTRAFGDDDSEAVPLTDGRHVRLFGAAYPTLYIGSNGYLTFASGDISFSESVANHHYYPRVAALFDDLGPSASGRITWKQFDDRIAVTWLGVSELSTGNLNNFQIEMFFDGKIRMTLLGIAARDGLIGLSAGNAIPAGFVQSDFSEYPPPPARVAGLTATGGDGQASITWAESAGATSYVVKRATAPGGPYATVGASNTLKFTNTGLTNGTTYYYVVSARSSLGESDDSAPASVTPLSPGMAWRLAAFGSIDDTGNGADSADPDSDNIPNLLERALGGNPNLAEHDLLPAVDDTQAVLTIRYRKAKAATDLNYTVQESPDLSPGSWTTAQGTSKVLSDDGAVQVIGFTVPVEGSARKFLRVQISR